MNQKQPTPATIGFDLSGVIGRTDWHPRRIPIIPAFLPVPGARNSLKQLSKNYRVIIVTARPRWTRTVTRLWLWVFHIPYHIMYVVADGPAKAPILIREGVVFYTDDKEENVRLLRTQGVNTHLFSNWKETLKLLTV